jgi:hypothetical protein
VTNAIKQEVAKKGIKNKYHVVKLCLCECVFHRTTTIYGDNKMNGQLATSGKRPQLAY